MDWSNPAIRGKLSVTDQLLDVLRALDIKVIFDVGSRDALDGLYLLDSLAADELHAFECNPTGVEICRSNVDSYNGHGRAFLVDNAVSSQNGVVSFYPIDPLRTRTSWPDGNPGASSLLRANPAYANETYVQNEIEVESVSLDSYCRSHPMPDFVWMDLQGAELDALKGAAGVLPHVKAISVEVAFRQMYLGQPLFSEVDSLLHAAGFRLLKVTGTNQLAQFLRFHDWFPLAPWFGDALYLRAGNR